ncbi:hypothetical protein [uncultured Phycicoccus sp.]|uniref:hypothetical protein n=1 Tax=uncultured Phycicoccus sp. TaxID=661422 RepID=UPI0026325439|nr:hypothetical protein [uncultured Phycicoccus sp.]
MLRRRIILSAAVGLLLALAVGVVGQAYAAGLPDEYTAQSVVIFGSRPTENGSIASSDSVQAAAAGYVAYLSAPSTLREVAQGIGEESADLKDGLAVTQLPATGTIRIDYATTDPDRAARGANSLASALAKRTVSDPVVYGQVLARAAVPLQPSGPPRTVLLAATVLIALLVGAGAATAAWALTGLIARRHATGPEHTPAVLPLAADEAEDAAVLARLAAATTAPAVAAARTGGDTAVDATAADPVDDSQSVSDDSEAVAAQADPTPAPEPTAEREPLVDDEAAASDADQTAIDDDATDDADVVAEDPPADAAAGSPETGTPSADGSNTDGAPKGAARPKPGPNGRRGPRGRSTARSRKAR